MQENALFSLESILFENADPESAWLNIKASLQMVRFQHLLNIYKYHSSTKYNPAKPLETQTVLHRH